MNYINEVFELNLTAKNQLKATVPIFGYGDFGEAMYYKSYSRNINGYQEHWADTVIRVIEGIFSIRKSHYVKNHIEWDEQKWQWYASKMALSMFQMEWLPPGRGLFAMGTRLIYERGAMALYNCFSGDTKFYTGKGVKTMKNALDQDIDVLCADNKYRKATVKCFGDAKLKRIVLKPRYGKSGHRLTYKATSNHRWILSDGSVTSTLKKGDCITVSNPGNAIVDDTIYNDGFAHGLVFGDGTKCTNCNNRYQIRLCGKDNKYIETLKKCTYQRTISYPPTYEGDAVVSFIPPADVNYKEFPLTTNSDYLLGFLEGWLAADSHTDKTGKHTLDSTNKYAYDWCVENTHNLGYLVVGHSVNTKDSNFGERKPLHRIKLTQEQNIEYIVECIYSENEETVYCVVEPETETFTLAGGIPTKNCAFTNITDETFTEDICWAMDSLMYGTGVGFAPVNNSALLMAEPWKLEEYIIPDTREGWVEALRRLLNGFVHGSPTHGTLPKFDYSQIRPEGAPIKTFGGTASGPAPLIDLLTNVEERCYRYVNDPNYNRTMLKTDIANLVGVCVVTGNLRRSAEIAVAPVNQDNFIDLKNYDKYPYRAAFGWMSNNSVGLESSDDFSTLGEVASRIVRNGEPGILNWANFPKGRLNGKDDYTDDKARGINPCGEIPLEDKEVCNVVETLPTRCAGLDEWLLACEYATFYASTVALLPTHQQATNAVIARNRRIGVSIVDFTGWLEEVGTHAVITYLRKGYKHVRKINKELADEAGVPVSIRVTTAKPGGTVPKMAGRQAGISYPTFEYTCTRVRVQRGTAFERILLDAGVPCEPDFYSKQTMCFEFPVAYGPAPPAEKISIWQQAANLVLVQREWADNAVSNTLYFKPKWTLVYDGVPDPALVPMGPWLDKPMPLDPKKFISTHIEPQSYKLVMDFNMTNIRIYTYNSNHEEDQIEAVLSYIMPCIKSVSLLPHTAVGVYKQMPQEGISAADYIKRINAINTIDWSKYNGSDCADEKYCDGDKCTI